MLRLRSSTTLVALTLVVTATRLPACGPFFPNNLLDSDQAMFVAPLANFQRELQRMNLGPSRLRATPLKHDSNNYTFADQTADAELNDLRAALKRQRLPSDELKRICNAHQFERDQLRKYLIDTEKWENSGTWVTDDDGGHWTKPTTPPPTVPAFQFTPGLPDEFVDYFEGAVIWHNPLVVGRAMAREPWERLLERPPEARKFKSTWAAFMLGKSWEKESPDKAIEYYKQVRDLARQGFSDSVGLASASLGLEARIYYEKKDVARAIHYYLEQFGTGDQTALSSLRLVSARALHQPDILAELARDNRSRRVITAYLVSEHYSDWNESSERRQEATNWLAAVESAGSDQVELAEQLALAAYQNGAFGVAQRWINRSKNSPVSQWLQAKLFLRAGKIEAAATMLARISRSFPEEPSTNAPTSLAENLWIGEAAGLPETFPAGRQILGEIGVLRLARHDYVQSLDALLRAGFWDDAAYVAERVLTVDELLAYVQREWSGEITEEPRQAETDPDRAIDDISPSSLQRKIRYLLGRRFTRLGRTREAGQFFPAEWQAQFQTFVQALDAGWDEAKPNDVRARAFFTAAVIARTNGLELIGTEVSPDWNTYGANYEGADSAHFRTNENLQILPASTDEQQRAIQHGVDPDKRYHYRYHAAALAWEAAKLMPDNSEETARVLCRAGTWIKYRDPKTADLFYKALVRRCRATPLGKRADELRWFPELDEAGNPLN